MQRLSKNNLQPSSQGRVTQAITAAMFFMASQMAWAQGEVTSIQTHHQTATATNDTHQGANYQWGTGNDLIIDGFNYNGRDYDYQLLADNVQVRRVDNPLASGESCSVFAQTQGSALNYSGTSPSTETSACDMAAIISSNRLNVGALDVFSNDPVRPYSVKNIERVDLIVSAGILTSDQTSMLDVAGHTLIEKFGNNPLKIAAILALDSQGDPSAYGSLVQINPATSGDAGIKYGMTNVEFFLDFLGTLENSNKQQLTFGESHYESMGMAFISQTDLGLTIDQEYFGFSVFPNDVNSQEHNLLEPESFPKNTLSIPADTAGDADFFAAFAIPEVARGIKTPPVTPVVPTPPITPTPTAANQPPVANDDSDSTLINTPVDINVLLNDSDPDGDTLIVTIIEQPLNGTVSNNQGIVTYTPNQDSTATDRFVYSISDNRGGTDTAEVSITLLAVKGSTAELEPIQTALKGHGGGSSSLWGLLALLGLSKIRRTFKK